MRNDTLDGMPPCESFQHGRAEATEGAAKYTFPAMKDDGTVDLPTGSGNRRRVGEYGVCKGCVM